MHANTPRNRVQNVPLGRETSALFSADECGERVAVGVRQLDGPTQAANLITGADIKNNTVTGKDIKDSSLKGADVKDDSLTGADVAESSLTKVPSAALADSATGVAANSPVYPSRLRAKKLQANEYGHGETDPKHGSADLDDIIPIQNSADRKN